MKTPALTPNTRTVAQNRHIYFLFGKLNIRNPEAIADIIYQHTGGRTNHTSELSFIEALNLIKWLNTMVKEKRLNTSERTDLFGDEATRQRLDRKRKGLIKAIFRWYELQGKQVTMDYMKATACQAAQADSFNAISEAALSRLYAEFCNKQNVVMAINNKNYAFPPLCQN